MRRAVQPGSSRPRSLSRLAWSSFQASVIAPPAVEGLLAHAQLATHLFPTVRPLPGSILPPELADDLLHGVLLACYLALPVFGDGAKLALERSSSYPSVPA